MTEDARLAHWLASQRGQVTRESSGDPHAHVDVDTLTRHACRQLSRAKAHAVTEHLLVCDDGRCVAFVRAQASDAAATTDFLYPPEPDADAMHARTFTCRDVLWETFSELSNDVEAPIDDLINAAMTAYAQSRGYHEGPTERRQDRAAPNVASRSVQQTTRAPADSEELSESEPSARSRASHDMPPSTMRPGMALTPEAVPRAPQSARALVAPNPSVTLSAPRSAAPRPLPAPSRGAPMPMAPPPSRSAPGAPPSRRAPPPLPSTPAVAMPPPAAASPLGSLALSKRLVLAFAGQNYPVDKDHFIIGRSKGGADLRIDDPNVSRQHAAIERLGSVYYLVDLGSTNGIYIGEDRVTRRAIVDGDVITITTHRINCTLR